MYVGTSAITASVLEDRVSSALDELKEKIEENNGIPTYAIISNFITPLDGFFQEKFTLALDLQQRNDPGSMSKQTQRGQDRRRSKDPRAGSKQTPQDEDYLQHIGPISTLILSTIDSMDKGLSTILREFNPQLGSTDLVLLIDQAVDCTLAKTLGADPSCQHVITRLQVEPRPEQVWKYQAFLQGHRIFELVDLRARLVNLERLSISVNVPFDERPFGDQKIVVENIAKVDWSRYLEATAGVIRVSSTNGLVIGAIVDAALPQYSQSFEESFHLSNLKPGNPNLTFREVGFWEHGTKANDSTRAMPSTNAKDLDSTVIVFPCLQLVGHSEFEWDREEYKELRRSLSTNIKRDNAARCKVHTARTLDEAYYPGISEAALRERNDDQVVSEPRQTRKKMKGFPILIVPQLWLWKLGNTIISAHEYEEDAMHTNELEVVEDQYLQMGIFMANRVEQFRHGQDFGSFDSLSTLDVFEQRVVSVLTDVMAYTKTTTRKDIDYKTEVELLYRLSDCRSELAMIQHILAQQKDIMQKLLKKRDESQYRSEATFSHSWADVQKALKSLDEYQTRTEKIDGDAERIEKTSQDLLNLKRTFASVEDSHASVLISTAAIGFAVVTIFFTPLAFLTALFALNMNSFDRLRVGNSGGDSTPKKDLAYHGGKMAGIFVGTEFLTFLITGVLVGLSLKRFDIMFGGRAEDGKEETPMARWKKDSMVKFKRRLLGKESNIKTTELGKTEKTKEVRAKGAHIEPSETAKRYTPALATTKPNEGSSR
ncbi:hypothetical protein HBI24_170160 [Parastagonospora nodorum]|nr:hypothetical protein HBH43_180080 [Parastagonospora nodorum]KAH4258483.1 hypothetical protein HBI03_143780 [Parastagonospora nodorum]KAH4271787.1 hypothetical protein HBI04_143130 [Parastagonospora nodorum]KAH4601338.1 hypothetical protein HBH82_179020 [Parastagonospora nodorum]KAH4677838.1 hypothetical protein HBH78_145900 [Parastagonospora nodorum]